MMVIRIFFGNVEGGNMNDKALAKGRHPHWGDKEYPLTSLFTHGTQS